VRIRESQQLFGTRERQRYVDRAGPTAIVVFGGDDESAAHGEVRLGVQFGAVLVDRGECHRIGMPLMNGQRAQHHSVFGEGDGLAAAEQYPPLFAHGQQSSFHLVGVDGLRLEALEPQQDGGHGAMASPGGGQ
jgi:hypothetical protein